MLAQANPTMFTFSPEYTLSISPGHNVDGVASVGVHSGTSSANPVAVQVIQSSSVGV